MIRLVPCQRRSNGCANSYITEKQVEKIVVALIDLPEDTQLVRWIREGSADTKMSSYVVTGIASATIKERSVDMCRPPESGVRSARHLNIVLDGNLRRNASNRRRISKSYTGRAKLETTIRVRVSVISMS